MLKTKTEPQVEVMNIEIPSNWMKNNYIFSSMGKLPLLWYNGITIPTDTITNFYLDTEGFLPRLRVYFKEPTDTMGSYTFAMDNTIISLFIDSRTKDNGQVSKLRPIRMDFKIVDYGFDEEQKLLFIQGLPNVDGLYLQQIQAYEGKTSYTTLQELASKIKLGFRCNVDGTDDKMNWLNPGIENYKFIQQVTENSYKNDSCFFTSFVDYYYSLNMVEVETELKEDINNIKGVLTSLITSDESKGQTVSDLYLTNTDFYSGGYNIAFNTHRVINRSTKISLKNGYRTELFYYDRTGNWEQKAGSDLKFVLETNTDNKGIILKSFPKDNSAGGFFQNNNKRIYVSPLDVDNTHTHYNYAHLLNSYNLEELNKIEMVVSMVAPNFNFYKFQKIKVLIYEASLFNTENILNSRLSGGWLITAINFRYTPEIGLIQEIKMVKRELSAGNYDV